MKNNKKIDTSKWHKVPLSLTEKEYKEYSKINQVIVQKIIASALYSANFDMTNIPGVCTQIFIHL